MSRDPETRRRVEGRPVKLDAEAIDVDELRNASTDGIVLTDISGGS